MLGPAGPIRTGEFSNKHYEIGEESGLSAKRSGVQQMKLQQEGTGL